MAWSADFLAQLEASNLAPLYLLESLTIGAFLPGEVALSSFTTPGYAAVMALENSAVNYGRLKLPEGSVSFGSLTIGLTHDYDPRPDLRRGIAVQLRVGFDGWEVSQFETVFLGVIWNVQMQGGQWFVVIRDIFAGLSSRWVDPTATDGFGLFGPAVISSPLTVDYTVGDGTITVSSTSAFEREDGGDYLLQITSDTTTPFYIKATAATGTVFTVTEADTFGTTRVNVLVADNATAIGWAYIEDRPCIAAKKVLVSTGTPGQHGVDDTLPSGWGFALPPDLVDSGDIGFYNTAIGASPLSRIWDIFTTEQRSPLAWLEGVLATGGYYLTQLQGRATVRGLAPPDVLGQTPNGIVITEDDIVEYVGYSTYDDNLPVEYATFRVLDGPQAASEVLQEPVLTRPANERKEASAAHVWTSTAEWLDAIVAQLGPWYTRLPELFRLQLRGWRAGQMAPGDTCVLSQNFLTDRQGRPTVDRIGLVLECHPNWFGATTDVVIAFLPSTESEA